MHAALARIALPLATLYAVGAACAPQAPPAEERAEVAALPLSGDCGLCATDALGGTCAAELDACAQSDACLGAAGCVEACAPDDADCLLACAGADPLLADLVQCVLCDTCAAECGADLACGAPQDPQDPADPGDPQDPQDPGDPGDPQDPQDPGDPGGDCATCTADALQNECSLEQAICEAISGCSDVLACVDACGADLACAEGCLDAAGFFAGEAARAALECAACFVCGDVYVDLCCAP